MKNIFRFFYHNGFVIGFILLQLVAFWLIGNFTFYQQSKLYQAGNSFTGSIEQKKAAFTHYLNLDFANQELVEENARLKTRKKESWIVVNKEYAVIDDTLRKIKYRYYPAKVINSSYNKVENFLTLNKGLVGGIQPGMAVVNSDGLVGITTSVSDNFSIVMPLIHPRAWFSVQVKGKHYFGILKWDGRDFRKSKITEIAQHARIVPGDTIETRESDILPEGIPVGVVLSAEPEKGSNYLNVSVSLFADFSKIYYVYVIENLMSDEQHQLEEAAKK